MTEPMISVIIPVYNVESHLANCVNSLIIGNSDTDDIEIILVNDGSTDKSAGICDDFASDYPFIQVIHKQNEGLATARNVGINAAKGKYITFIDSDDYVSEGYLDFVRGVIKEQDIIAFSCYIDYSEYEKTVICQLPEKVCGSPQNAVRELEANDSFNVVWNKVYSASLLNENNIRFAVHSEPGEDLLFNCQCFQCAQSISLVDTPFYHWVRRGEDTLANRFRPDLWDKVQTFINARTELYCVLKMDKTDIDSLSYGNTKYVFSCVPNMYRVGRRFSRKNRMRFYQTILQSEEIRTWIGHTKTEDKLIKQFVRIYQTGSAFWLDLFYSSALFVRNHFQPLYSVFFKKTKT